MPGDPPFPLLGGEDTADMLECEKKALSEAVPGVYSRQYLPLNRKVGEGGREGGGRAGEILGSTCL
jgi:hypothetical protein